jgi:hypothetical protein
LTWHGRVGEDVAALTPHSPGRAQLRHPVLRYYRFAYVKYSGESDYTIGNSSGEPLRSRASLAIRSCFVDTLSGFNAPSHVSQERFCNTMPPFPLAGPRRAAFPTLSGTTKALRLPDSNTGSLMDSLTRPDADPSVRSATASDPAARPGPAQARCLCLSLIGRCSGAPRFLGSPSHAFAPLCDPGRSNRTHQYALPVLPPLNRWRRHSALAISGLNHAASASAAYASTRTVTRLTQGSLPAGG